MADLKTKMTKVAAGKPAPAEVPFRPPGPQYNHRISFDVTDDMYDALRTRAFHNRIPMVELVRTFVTNGLEE